MKKEGVLNRYSAAIPCVIIAAVIVAIFLYALYRDYEERPQPLRYDQITALSRNLEGEYGVAAFEVTYKNTQLDVHIKGPSYTDNERQEILGRISQLIASESFKNFFEKKASERYRGVRPFSAINRDTPYLDKWIPEEISVFFEDVGGGVEITYFSAAPFLEWIQG